MREITKRTIIRFSKVVHFCVTVLLFVGCISLFYPEQNQVLQTVLYFAIALFSVRTYNALQMDFPESECWSIPRRWLMWLQSGFSIF